MNMKKYCIEMTRKLFYVFDMVLLALLFFSLEHTLFREDIIIDTMLDVALWLRIIIPFLLYRYEEKAVWPITIFVALFGYVYYSDALYNTIQTMGHFPSIMFNSIPSLERQMMSVRDTTGMVVMRGIIYWIWLIPFAAYIILTACKLTKDNDYPWYYFLGGIMFNDKVRRLIYAWLQCLLLPILLATKCRKICLISL